MIKKFLALAISLTVITPFSGAVFAQPAIAATNFITNPSVETADSGLPSSWLENSWGTNTPTFTYQNTGQNGARSLSVQMSSYVSGDAKWYFAPVAVTGGHSYVFSDYYKATVQTFLVAQIDDGGGNLNYFQIGNALAASSSWKKISSGFTVPAGVATLTVFHLINKNGTLQTDNFDMHEADQGIAVTNGVPNFSLEQVSEINSKKPAGWSSSSWGTNTSNFTYLTGGAHSGTHAVKTQITSYVSGDAKWFYQSQPVSGGQKLTFSDYYKANIASRVVLEFTNLDLTQTYVELKSTPVSSVWAKYSDSFTTPAAAVSLTVFHLISAVGTLSTDDYSVNLYVPTGFNRALVSLTFDDGFASQYTSGGALLLQYNFNATFFITTGFLNSSFYYMTDSTVMDLKNSGNEIADHTVSHPRLTGLSGLDLTSELHDSQAYLQNHFGVTANDFASPFGEVDDQVLTGVKTYFRSHRGVADGYNYKDSFDIYNLKVKNVLVTTTTAEVEAWLQEAARTKGWLILVYHQVDSGGDTYSVLPKNFASQLDAINRSLLAVVTIDQALNEVSPQVGN